ncbi:MAG TPA: AmmeMemoRadiSam system protein A [Candidatus Polarisedimenticolaceae bacterium]|nr:AmmeMemoRadiSam system protein A [Candidatus Polarisedimenticolaceae bacterium]
MPASPSNDRSEPALTAAERDSLLRLARAAIREALLHDSALARERQAVEITAGLAAPRGVFVTLRAEELRGCVGRVVGDKPLHVAVAEVARQSALEDPRFPPVSAAELPQLRIEISALTPLRPLADITALVLGRDGVQLSYRGRRSVFLPQVAIEQGWGAEEFLQQLSRKAGLPPEAWRDAVLEAFEAEVFSEDLR